jgi:hypothetical protein
VDRFSPMISLTFSLLSWRTRLDRCCITSLLHQRQRLGVGIGGSGRSIGIMSLNGAAENPDYDLRSSYAMHLTNNDERCYYA